MTTPTDRPDRRRGGHELPDDVQDRPEQNAGYDAAVEDEHGEPGVDAASEAEFDTLVDKDAAEAKGIRIKSQPD